jgi:AAA domain
VSASGFGADRFGWTDDALAELRAARGWTEPAIERLELTYDPSSGLVGIPIRDAILDELGRLTYNPRPGRGNGRPKMQGPAGVPRQLFPPPELIRDGVDDVLVLEGEPDVVAAWSAGLVAIGVPGVGGWHPTDAARFRGPRWTVYVVFDCDTVGRSAAAEVAASLLELGVDVRMVDLAPDRDDGYDVTDYLLEQGVDALRELMAASELYSTEPPGEAIVFEPLGVFLERALPPAESLVGVARGGTNLLPRYGWVMPWGREGSGKTSVIVDLLFHAAAGLEWLGWPVGRPLRLVVIVNEGVPGGFQDKLAAKVEAWPGDHAPVIENIAVYASPWGEFTFRSDRMTNHARAFALDFGADYVAFDPLHTLGTFGAGGPEDTESFKHVLRAFGLWDDLGVLTAHHSNKSGMVSGDWARHPDTVLHLEKDGRNPATKLTLEKARPADPGELGVPVMLEWVVETFGYRRVELEVGAGERVDDDELLKRVTDYLAARESAVPLKVLKGDVKGDPGRLASVVRAAIERGEIIDENPHPQRLSVRKRLDSDPPSSRELSRGDDEEQTRMDIDVSQQFDPSSRENREARPADKLATAGRGPKGPRPAAVASASPTDDDNLDEDDPWT